MGMSDCEKCWVTPCVCGHDYRDWSEEQLREQIAMLEGMLREKYLAATTAVLKGYTANGTPVMGMGKVERPTLVNFGATIQMGKEEI